MSSDDLLTYDEQLVIAAILASPRQRAWELEGLDPGLFRPGRLRSIAEAVCALRASHGTRWRWRHVVRWLRSRGRRNDADLTRRLYWAVGTSAAIGPAFSRLVDARMARSRRRARGHPFHKPVDFETRERR